ncbi:MAG: phosphoribosylamine--glycine ligase [Caldiserica bacterium]|nr:phosphoribosylamine--glycine ligase [Caldisericota bacterium]
MKVLVIGKGGREHALMWKLSQSKGVSEVYYVKGNAGMEKIGKLLPGEGNGWENLAETVQQENIDFTVVGPEQPLVEGIVNVFKDRGLRIFGPEREAAQLEGSKVFAKELMRKYGIPTATFVVFSEPEKAIRFLENSVFPLVIKADGLAAGKGAIVCQDFAEGKRAVERIMVEKEFGEAGEKIIVEEFLEGHEASIIGVTDGEEILLLPSSQDHKQIYDGDRGPNTGGMGAYAPCPLMDEELLQMVREKIMLATVKAMQKEGKIFKGVLYAGLMIGREGPKVLEFNVRFGDPETQALLPLLKTDFLELLMAAEEGSLKKIKNISREKGYAVCVVIASEGYPGNYEKGKTIEGIEQAEKTGCIVFQAGTKTVDGKVLTDGGRVMGVVGKGNTLPGAIEHAYQGVKQVHFAGMYYRKDIGAKGLKYSENISKEK